MSQIKNIADCELGSIGIINLPTGNEYVLVIESDIKGEKAGLVLSKSYFQKTSSDVEILLIEDARISINLTKESVALKQVDFAHGAIRLDGKRKLISFDAKDKLQQIDVETGSVETYCLEALPVVRTWMVVVPGTTPSPSVLNTLIFDPTPPKC